VLNMKMKEKHVKCPFCGEKIITRDEEDHSTFFRSERISFHKRGYAELKCSKCSRWFAIQAKGEIRV